MVDTLNDEEKKAVDLLAQYIGKLSDKGRERLLGLIGAMDLRKFEDADIKIDDWKGADKNYPRATIQFNDGTEETIDIIKTVKDNATSIGHPAILLAIRRWEHITLYNIALRSQGEHYKSTDEAFCNIAQTHLQNIGQALIDGAKYRAFTKPLAINLRKALGTEKDYILLKWVWTFLDKENSLDRSFSNELYGKHTVREKCKLLQQKLKNITNMLVNLREAPVVQLQSSPNLRDYISTQMVYTPPTESRVQVKLADGKLEWYSLDIPFNWALQNLVLGSDIEIKLKPPKGPYCWVKLSELLKQTKIEPSLIENQITLAALVSDSSYTIPQYGFKPRERKLAALLGFKEFASELPKESFKKEKIDLIIDFLKSEEGSKYLTTRPNWEIFCSSFDSWRFGASKSTLRKYRNRAKNKAAEKSIYYGSQPSLDGTFIPPNWLKGVYLFPDFLNEYSFDEITNWLSLPVVLARKPK